MRVLLVEDDDLLANGLQHGLTLAGFTVDRCGRAADARHLLSLEVPDLAIVDLGLPDMDGTQLLAWMRGAGHAMPVLILTARDTLEDTVGSLNLGADDYMVKPFRLPELIARLRALVRRAHARHSPTLELGRLTLDTATRIASAAGCELDLSPREWTILEHLMLVAPHVVGKQRLLEALSGWERDITLNAIEVHISRLRQKLRSESGVSLRTVRGLGYRLEASDEPAD